MFQPEVFSKNLQILRKKHGFSQAELASRLFVSTQAISKWERGQSIPDLAHLCKLSALYDLSMDALIGIKSHTEKTLIAVDGGGTKTEFVLINLQGAILKRLLRPGSNPNIYGTDKAYSILKEGIESLLQTETQVLGLYIGGSGMGVGDNAAVIKAKLKTVYPYFPIFCDTDIRNVLACGDDPNNSIAVISGTGSVVYACDNGSLIRLGGSGYLFDKLGSGFDMGRDAVFAALEHRDGTGPETALTALVEKRLGGKVWDHIQEFYSKDTSYIASFAPDVFSAYEEHDPVAVQIVERNSRRLAELIRVASKKAPRAKSVILSGSLFTKSAVLYNRVADMIPDDLSIRLVEYPQIWGACLQCARLCGIDRPSEQRFMSDYRLFQQEEQ